MRRRYATFLPVLAIIVLQPPPASAQLGSAPEDAAADYRRAERLLSWNAQELVFRDAVSPNWLENDRFWYRNRIPEGHEFVLVDARRGSRALAFDHARLAAALSGVTGRDESAFRLPFGSFEFADGERAILFSARDGYWRCDVRAYRCEAATRVEAPSASATSPDGSKAAFIRAHDLWVIDLRTGQQTRLTTDGAEHYGYATDSQGWRNTDQPILLWSPDSRMIATYRLDERGVGDMHLLRMAGPRPELRTWKYALPGDSIVPMHERVVLHLDGPRVVRLDSPPDHQRASSCCGLTRAQDRTRLVDAEWSPAGDRFAFVSTSRDYRTVALRLADPQTGAVRTVLQDHDPVFFESTSAVRGYPNWRVLHARGVALWFSRRDDWGHLYLYDLNTGALQRQLTSGEWNVLNVEHVDERNGWIYFTAAGREANRDPYHRHLYRMRLDGSGIALLTPEDADHDVTVSPSGQHFVNSYSRLDQPPVTVLRRADGRVVTRLEEADASRLFAAGWRAPERIRLKARDGVTDIYGVLHKPSNFDPSRRYPIINYIYPGPQAGSIGVPRFSATPGGQRQALAELGFIVVAIDALGTPMRSREFHIAYAGDLGDNGLPDQIAAMRQLAAERPYIDLDRVGIYGHSGGGFATAAAMLRHPDFFHVGVASAGNHDNRGYTDYWGEKWHGLLEKEEGGADNYERQATQLLAGNLRGKLLLSYGTMDSNVHPNMTHWLIDELIRHNKDFDLIVLPNRGHGYGTEPYHIRRTWDYFVRHLQGREPPREFELRRGRAVS